MLTRAPETPSLSLAERLNAGKPVVLAFFKISCPTCQLAFPFLEQLHARGNGALQFLGVSQDDDAGTAAFVSRYGVTFPVELDRAGAGYRASNAYGLTHVPSIFVVEPDGSISHSWTGFARADFEKLAELLGTQAFTAADHVPAWKPG